MRGGKKEKKRIPSGKGREVEISSGGAVSLKLGDQEGHKGEYEGEGGRKLQDYVGPRGGEHNSPDGLGKKEKLPQGERKGT